MALELGRAEKAWGICTAAAIAFFVLTLGFSYFLGGYGIMYSDGEFLLGQGKGRRPVDQGVGSVFFLVSWAFILSLFACIPLSFAVYIRRGTLRLNEVFHRFEREQSGYFLGVVLVVCLIFVSVALTLLALR